MQGRTESFFLPYAGFEKGHNRYTGFFVEIVNGG